ncbi:MAG: hypothetical protein IJS67_05010 [Clostridia bacterium]|nr:hypothetical protein [Clostridia bacterium]
MVKIVYGPKGFGKTKIILDDVNAAAKVAKGNVVLITDKKFNSVSVDLSVRCVYTEEYGVTTAEAFDGFVKGLIAGNSDIEYLFIDGIARITHADLKDLGGFMGGLDALCAQNSVNLEMTISSTKEDLPEYLLKYIG